MSILERATKHFELQEVKQIEVPEWPDEKGNPTILYAEPLSLGDRKTLSKYAKEDDTEFLIRLIIMKARTSDGKAVFDLSDKPMLLTKVDPNVLNRIANDIAETASVEVMSGN